MILCEAGLLEEALSKLEENATVIVDKVSYMERRGEAFPLSDILLLS